MVRFQTNSKSKNQPTIERLISAKEYKVNEKQRSSVMKKVNIENYETPK